MSSYSPFDSLYLFYLTGRFVKQGTIGKINITIYKR